MSSYNGHCFHFEHIKGILKYLYKIASEFGVDIEEQLQKDAIEETLSHYYDHVTSYNVRVTGIDPYKFAAWSGMYLFRRLDNHKIIAATIATLRRFLLEEGKSLDDVFCQKLLLMAYHDEKKESIAIGKNGLYMSFRTASETTIPSLKIN